MSSRHTKLPDWRDRLHALIRERQRSPFEWGPNDCVSWTADAVLAQTGIDDLAAYRGRYSTATGALKALRRIDKVERPIDLVDRLWGPRHHISSAKLGDPVVLAEGLPESMGPSVGICYGLRSLFVGVDDGRPGLVRVDTLSLEHCYLPWVS